MSESPIPSLLADAPISDPKLDRLGRAGFAGSLASSILALGGQDSFVIGVCGPWGSGKSSVLNLLVAELEGSSKPDKPLVLRFNPWWFSGQDRLLQAFLQQLGTAVNRVEKGKSATKASKLLGKLSTVLKPATLIPVIGEYAKLAQEAAASASDMTKQYADALASDLEAIRKEINELLGQLPHRIVIVMDDIDRLTAGEIGQLFSILKAVADFSKTVYVLAYDERVVRRAIKSTLGVSGKTYLEKIVQLPIDLPAPDRTTLHQLFLEQLQELLGGVPESASATTDFGNIFHDGLKHFLVTPRACKRLVNVLRFTLPPLRGEVYWPDAVGVACLTAFAPQVVRAITTHAERFVGHSDHGEGRKEAEQFHKRCLGSVNALDRTAVEGIVRRLFPKADHALGGSLYGADWEARWRIELRVRSEAHFEKYFRLSVPSGTMSEAEWQGFVGLLDHGVAFRQRLLGTCGRAGRRGHVTQAKEAVERLLDFLKLRATPAQAKQVFLAVMEIGDELAATEDKDLVGGLLPITNELRICWLLQQALAQLATPTERMQLIGEAMRQKVGLHTAAELVKVLGQQHGMYSSTDARTSPEPLVLRADVEELAKLVVQQIEAAATDGSLARHPSFMGVAWHWGLFGQAGKAAEWVRRLAASDDHLVKLIRQMRGEIRSHSFSDRVATATPHVDCAALGKYVPALEARRRCAALLAAGPDWLTAEDRTSLQVIVASIAEDGTVRDLRAGQVRPMQNAADEPKLSTTEEGREPSSSEG
ncbi:P-loop NTPase fold protein [Gemmata sp. JC717]|uniref:KAP family P-loop NTPase fold protein n=1 Tax=Gemmata algarum TaxID=2975278 RepID=UPI0021BB7C5A|nr:P-loop NTPase fold protein [Gemmata algarum]MDY3556172.1 P-loop NTPase fold protein [Gemmata algarum]